MGVRRFIRKLRRKNTNSELWNKPIGHVTSIENTPDGIVAKGILYER